MSLCRSTLELQLRPIFSYTTLGMILLVVDLSPIWQDGGMSLPLKPRVLLLDVIPPDMDADTAERRLTELSSLTSTYGGLVIVHTIQRRNIPNYQTYVGSGKLEELIEQAKKDKVDLFIFNNLLKPKQMFNVGEILRKHNIVVWDRVDLILKIFQKHASTAEAKLQIKLAAIHHMGPRIFGMGMEMMQQGGGIGTRGQGETNIEIMKRHLAEQERTIKKHLEKASQTRVVHRERRRSLGMKTVSIVGYTNAGKSSLINALTRKGSFVANQLFATLDTRVAKLWLPEINSGVLLSDTIGFIQDLPPDLISAFRSTLEEAIEADLLLHVIDVTDPYLDLKIGEVEGILHDLGIHETPRIYVFNKIDLKKKIPRASLKKKYAKFHPVFVSSVTGEGMEELKGELVKEMGGKRK